MINPISFKAQFINKGVVKSTLKNGDIPVSFVKIDTESHCDINSLNEMHNQWGNRPIVDMILHNICLYPKSWMSIYVLTQQIDNFKNLDAKSILGIVEISKNIDAYQVDYLQTKPDYVYSESNRSIKHIGKTIMDSIIKLTGKTRIYLESEPDATEFYKKLGFKIIQENNLHPVMVLSKTKLH